MRSIFLTGGTGFVGGRLLARVAARPEASVIALARNPPAATPAPNVGWLRGDLLHDGDWTAALRDSDTILHLAAATGKLPADHIRRTNVEATRRLLELARDAGVRRFLFVSSIAARFANAPHYHYAASKREAERLVATSGLRTLIVRPTMVLGGDSPIGRSLRTLAAAPVLLLFGNGRSRIQPIHVDDLARVLLDLALDAEFDGRTVEVGGPEAVSIEAFLRRLHHAIRGGEPRTLHLPVPPLRTLLALVERVSVDLVPFTAGQLATFTNDGIIEHGGCESGDARLHDVESMVGATARDG